MTTHTVDLCGDRLEREGATERRNARGAFRLRWSGGGLEGGAPPGGKRMVVAAGGRGREEEAGGTDLRRRQRWERQAEERRLYKVWFHQVGFYPRSD
jgi:hypothetical protein